MESVQITDHHTGKTTLLDVSDGCIAAADLSALGITSLDPGYLNTAVCKSAVSYIDGEKGILRYRGYDIADLAENCTFTEVVLLG